MKTATPKKHAKYSPSSLYRVMACAGSVKLSENAPPSRTSAAAEEGTKAHELVELMLLRKKFDSSKYPAYMHDDAKAFAEVVLTESSKAELLVETKVDLRHIHAELYGTADVSVVGLYDKLHVIDFKYGRGFISEKKNPQLMTYLLGIAHLYNYDFADYETSIYQPRYNGKAMRTYQTTKRELLSFEEQLKWAIDRAETENAPLNKGSHCHFCPAKFTCPELTREAMNQAKLDFDNEVQPDPVTFTKENLSVLLDKANYLKLWLAEVEAYASELLTKGEKIKGYSLQPTRPTTKWRDESKLKTFIDSKKLNKFFYETSLVSPATARKVLSKKFSDKELEKFLSLQTVSVSSGYKLKNNNDTVSDFDLEN